MERIYTLITLLMLGLLGVNLTSCKLFAQHSNSYFDNPKRITEKDGLPSNNVNGLFQDSKGFVWITSQGGISRYDGYEVLDLNQLVDFEFMDRFTAYGGIEDTQTGNLWFGTSHGVILYNPFENKVTNLDTSFIDNYDFFNSHVTNIIQIEQEIWITPRGGGLAKYDRIAHRFDNIIPSKLLPDKALEFGLDKFNEIFSVVGDSRDSSIIWMTNRVGLIKWNTVDDSAWFYPHGLPQALTRGIYQDHKGVIYLASWRHGFWTFDSNTYEFKIQDTATVHDRELNLSRVTSIVPISDNELYISFNDNMVGSWLIKEERFGNFYDSYASSTPIILSFIEVMAVISLPVLVIKISSNV